MFSADGLANPVGNRQPAMLGQLVQLVSFVVGNEDLQLVRPMYHRCTSRVHLRSGTVNPSSVEAGLGAARGTRLGRKSAQRARPSAPEMREWASRDMDRAIRVYKYVFRLDYGPRFELLDSIGKLAAHVDRIRSDAPGGSVQTTVELNTEKITSAGELDGARYSLNLSVTSLDGVAEFRGHGRSLGERIPLLQKAEGLLVPMGVSTFRRIGYRTFVLVTGGDLTFSRVRERIANQLRDPGASAATEALPGSALDDMAIVLEAAAGSQRIRVAYGPYRQREFRKYFSESPPVEEGMIFDIDVSQEQVELPSLKLERFARSAEERNHAMVVRIASALQEYQ